MTVTGIDLGATWIRGVVVEPDGTVGESLRIPTPDGPEAASEILLSTWKQLGGSDLLGLAAAPEFDKERIIRRWPNRPEYVGTNVLDLLEANGASPLLLDDASAAAVAEHLSATQGDCLPSATVLISVGTGVGGGMVINDRLWLGTCGGAMDLGHISIPAAGNTLCSCGLVGCLQSVASGRRLKMMCEQSGIAPDEIMDLAAAGKHAAMNILDSIAAALAESMLIIERLIQPDRIILGGGLMQANTLAEYVAKAAQELRCSTPILRSKWGTLSGAIGASVETYRRSGLELKRLSQDPHSKEFCIALIQGPNLNLLGEREPEFYGTLTLREIEDKMTRLANGLGSHLYCVQSNRESELVEWLHRRLERLDAAIVNPAALTAHGYALLDALTARRIPFFEVHLSNIDQRERWHQKSCFAPIAVGRISGMGVSGYELALRRLIEHLSGGSTPWQ